MAGPSSGWQSRGGGGDDDVAALLKPPPMKEPYFQQGANNPVIRRELLDEKAQEIALEFGKQLAPTQLRRFYEPVVTLRTRARAGDIDADHIRAEMALMKARVAYAHKRPGMNVPAALVKFFTLHAASADSVPKFLAFSRHFEAVVAYHRVFNQN